MTELKGCGCRYYFTKDYGETFSDEIRQCEYLCHKHKDEIILSLFNERLAFQQNKRIQKYISEHQEMRK